MDEKERETQVAVLTVSDIQDLSGIQVEELVKWLRREASFLKREYGNVAKKYRATYTLTHFK